MAAAIALERAGFDPRVFERAPELSEIGAGLGLTANAMKAMGYLGAAEFVRTTGVPVDATEWRSMDDGSRLFINDHGAQEGHYGEQYVCLHRADLLESLVREVPEERIRLSSRLVGFDETPDGVTAHFEDGHSEEGDLLVGADGLRSTVRSLLFGEQEARFTGVAAWRALIPVENMPPGFGAQIVVWFGRGRHCMTYPVRDDLCALNAFVPADEIHQEAWGPSGDLAHLRRSFAGRRAGRARPHRRRLRGPHHPDLLPRPAARVGHGPRRAARGRRASGTVQRGPGSGHGPRGRAHARRVPRARRRSRPRSPTTRRGAGRGPRRCS